jgi:hypothetical protein
MSGSSGSSGGKTASSVEVEDLKRIVRELGHLDQARAGDHENTPVMISLDVSKLEINNSSFSQSK